MEIPCRILLSNTNQNLYNLTQNYLYFKMSEHIHICNFCLSIIYVTIFFKAKRSELFDASV